MNAPSSIQSILAAMLCLAVLGSPVASPAGVHGLEIPSEEQALYVREQSILEEIKQAEEEKRKLEKDLKAFEPSVETMKTEALSDFRENCGARDCRTPKRMQSGPITKSDARKLKRNSPRRSVRPKRLSPQSRNVLDGK